MKRGFMVLAAALSLAATVVFAEGKTEKGSSSSQTPKRTKLVWLHNAGDAQQKKIDAVIAAFEKKYGIDIELELRPASAEGENLVKTRIAANDMPDLMTYNSGALFNVINPAKNLVDLSKEPYANKLLESFKMTVSAGNNGYYGIPIQPIQVGGVIYNKKIYSQLGLIIPKTWNEFLNNCEKIKATGKIPVVGSYKDDWSAQLILLADYYNVYATDPSFATDYTANKAKFANTPIALRGFEKLQEVFSKGYINKDAMSTTYDMAQAMLAKGEAAHYVMATWVLSSIATNFPDKINDIGFFALPGDSENKNGVTIWMPNNISIPKISKNIDAAKKFLEFYVSDEGLAAYMSVDAPDGAFAIKGVKLPESVFPAVKDTLAYIDANKTAPALEFLSPIKGPNLPQICVQDGLGLKSPAECAAEYDRDVEKQAKQLMLPLW